MRLIVTLLVLVLLSKSEIFAMGEGKIKLSWELYKAKYLKEKSYIVDPYNNNRVTSEAQGYGLIIALINNDKSVFDSLYNWSKKNLQREDNLFSWHWNNVVVDKNNASDGDLLIAYALLRAYWKWGDKYYLKEFESVNSSLKRLIVKIVKSKDTFALFLPAVYGFSNERYEITLYPSYYINFIIKEMSKVDRDWEDVYKSMITIYSKKGLSTTVKFSLLDKAFISNSFADIDLYRVIIYSFKDSDVLEIFKDVFKEVDLFFKQNGYIPFSYRYDTKEQEKREAPFCVYFSFYTLYKDEMYLEKYRKLLEVDSNNYFCDSLMLILEGLKNGF
ncbi:MAG: glycosyl hydrolase family 8 [Hydrogenothermaceae bacterium]|nr:glycosyl hydrolase family 8 [Hydrogenothermaceae bacterium]